MADAIEEALLTFATVWYAQVSQKLVGREEEWPFAYLFSVDG